MQNVAAISSWQITPVLGSCDVFVWPPAPSGCCGDCAATGDAKSSAAINASFFIFATRFALVHHRPAMRAATIAPERVHRRPRPRVLDRRGLVGQGAYPGHQYKSSPRTDSSARRPKNESTAAAESLSGTWVSGAPSISTYCCRCRHAARRISVKYPC